jgi:hypothetical protein
MPIEIVSALKARVWTACMWDQLHITADTLSHISDRAAYPGPRLVAAGVFPPERRFEDEGKPFVRDIAPEAFDAGHVVLNVAPGGNTYTVAYVTADDESMKVTGAYDFTSRSIVSKSFFRLRLININKIWMFLAILMNKLHQYWILSPHQYQIILLLYSS